MKLKYLLLILVFLASASCGKLPKLDGITTDKRTAYKQAESLEPLEVPPDLILESKNDMQILGESDSISLAEFQKRQRVREQTEGSDTMVLGSGGDANEQWIVLNAPPEFISAGVRDFWQEQGFSISLYDLELGVIETDWNAWTDTIASRHRFMMFLEPDPQEDRTILYLSGEQQDRLDDDSWLDSNIAPELIKDSIYKLSQYFLNMDG